MKKTLLFFLMLSFAFATPVLAQRYQYRVYDVTRYGAKCDGSTDDSTAMTAAVTAAVANGGGEIRFPTGVCIGTVSITEGRGLRFTGVARYGTKITGTGGNPAVQANGLWYSTFEGIVFGVNATRASGGVVELDGNYDGSHSQGVQGNTFKDCIFNANSQAAYGLAIVRQGGGAAQGSENLMLNCHFETATIAGFFSNGYNALQNTFIGGNFQGCKYGILVAYGSVNAISVGFQNALSGVRAQVEAGGYDVVINNSANDTSSIQNCRSESAVLISTNSGHRVRYQDNNVVLGGVSEWAASTAYSLGTLVRGRTAGNGDGRLYICIGAGTSAGTEPTWPSTSPTWSITGGGAITSGTAAFSCSGCGTMYGAYASYGIIVRGAGAAGADLYTTLSTQVDNSNWTLGANAGTTVTSANWRIGATVTDGSATWIQYDYKEAEFAGDSYVANNQWGTGRIGLGASGQYNTSYALTFIGNTFSRADWMYGSGANFVGNRLTAFSNTLRANGGPTTGKTAGGYALSYANGGPTPSTYTSPFTLGGQSLYWSGGASGTNQAEIGFVPDLATSKLSFNGTLVNSGTPQTLIGAGAVNLTTYSTLLVTTGADALTLAAGSEGQYKFIRMKTDGGDGTLTVTNLQGGTTITFNDAGDFVLLFYQDAKWHILTNSGCTVA